MRNQRGITLIALVITIIVLLILAGVTIAMLSGENGILTRATQTKAENAKAEATDQARLAYMTVRTEIAAKQAKSGSYSPASNVETPAANITGDTTLLSKVRTDLGADVTGTKWTDVSADTTPASGTTPASSTITMTYTDNALSGEHTATFTIVITDGSTPVFSGPTFN